MQDTLSVKEYEAVKRVKCNSDLNGEKVWAP